MPDLHLEIHLEAREKLNYACHQNAFPFLQTLRIDNNDTEQALDDVLVRLSSNPPFLTEKVWRLDRIAPEGSISIKDKDVVLDGAYLLQLTEAMRGTVTVTVKKDGEVLAEKQKPMQLLAYNEWGGAGYMPDLLAAFCLPNDDAVAKILRDASLLLQKAGRPDGIDGYQSRSRERVWELASAIYAAISNLGISYSEHPASFEKDGQKIRLPHHILQCGLATCLDASLLFAAALEQAGLHPVVVLPEGHALVGVWLQPENLPKPVIYKAEQLRKRVQLKELILIETTYALQNPALPFPRALEAGSRCIDVGKDKSFQAAVDIRRARSHQITPLALRNPAEPGEAETDTGATVVLPVETPPALPTFDKTGDDEVPDAPAGRLESWQSKLLDLTLRNRLLNHRATQSSLFIIAPDVAGLVRKLEEGEKLAIQPLPRREGYDQSQELHEQRTGQNIAEEYARDALERKQVLVDLAQTELFNRATNIYRSAKTDMEEGGSNTLFLALGFLRWKRDEKEDRTFRAPLVLLPVQLDRQSILNDIKIVASDDETRFNTTLLEMLRKDFALTITGLEGSLSTDESGLDVQGVWTKVQQAVRDVPGFEVVDDVVLGRFSFAKYLMWKDMVDRADALQQNSIVQHLVNTPRDPYPSDVAFVDKKNIDRDYKPSDLFIPLPADASQIAAIATADKDKDFVIIGPPGTGKSQTISNLIANTLGKGKTVLFVSEKTAALEVVHRRLEQIGIGKFCLPLHSHKANKKEVLQRLDRAWHSQGENTAQEWQAKAGQLLKLRNAMNGLVDRLHTKRSNGLTAHYAMGVKIKEESQAARVKFSWPSADYHSEDQLSRLREAAKNLRIQAAAVGNLTSHPLQLVENSDWSPTWQGEVVQKAGSVSQAVLRAEQALNKLLVQIDIAIPDTTLTRLDAVADLAKALKMSYRKQTAFALEQDAQTRMETLEHAVQRLRAYADAQASLSCAYEPMAWRKLDGRQIAQSWTDAEQAWWPKRFFARRRVLKTMKEGGAQGMPDPTRDAVTLTQLRKEGKAIDALDQQLATFKDWQGHTTSPEVASDLKNRGEILRRSVAKLADDTAGILSVRKKIHTLLREGNDLLAPDAVLGRLAEAFIEANTQLNAACAAFEAVAGSSIRQHFAEGGGDLHVIQGVVDGICEQQAGLNAWCAWRRRRTEAMDLQLMPLVQAIEAGGVPIDEIEETFEAAYCTWWSSAVINEDEVLLNFSTPEHNNVIQEFCKIDEEFQQLTAEYICAKLMGDIPDGNDVSRNPSWGVLRREIQKRQRHKPVRQLVKEIPDVLTKLAPCLMMSPLSVAQYLPAEQALFDVVIFDEASQITVWDAVGCLARGRQAIVAGDPKQMPPTNFFARAENDDNSELEGDLESILDEMLGASIPEQLLNLHYRSRNESLIAFSNSRYYDNELITFPAPVCSDKAVRLIQPDGFYARGKARHNEGEAEAVVKEIVRRLKHPDENVRKQSIGVVTFNTEQQSLINTLLDKARDNDETIEWAFSESEEEIKEPVFVKNLETVQGDERDVILFSITYGPDQAGHVTMNFGPLNRQGGERRLNVAMTRARSEMLVFSTLRADAINLARTNAVGVKDLKHFLEYAERGPSVLGGYQHGSVGDFDSPFEIAVARALRYKGWEVHPQVGVSAFRIDLGIVHPDEPGVYLAGVECDGAMYHSSACARERDKVRQSVLEGLGWTLFRVWSTDWWTNRAGALDILDTALKAHLQKDREQREEQERKRREELAENEEAEAEAEAEAADDDVYTDSDDEETLELEEKIRLSDPNSYTVADLTAEDFPPSPDMFYSDIYRSVLDKMIAHVIKVEAPVHMNVLTRRIARHHGFQRTGSKIRDLVVELASREHTVTQENVGVFFWHKAASVEADAVPARYKNRDEDVRRVEHICKEELLAIKNALGLDADPQSLARSIGVNRLGQIARDRLTEVLEKG